MIELVIEDSQEAYSILAQRGEPKFLQVIGENANRPAEAVADAVVQTVNSFRGSLKQEDDMTLIIIKFTKNG